MFKYYDTLKNNTGKVTEAAVRSTSVDSAESTKSVSSLAKGYASEKKEPVVPVNGFPKGIYPHV